MNGVRDVVLRVIVTSGEGQGHLQILKRLSSPPDILMSNNHILPILYEIIFQDIIILAVPKLIFNLEDACRPDKFSNSVEDLLYMVVQAFEGTAYLHRNLIAHQDLFLNNFMVEWMPGSLAERTSMLRPRVYIIDFEVAVEFPEDSEEAERLCDKFPYPLDIYARYVAPELETNQAYCPFRLDMWQLGMNLNMAVETGLEEIDAIWLGLCAPSPKDRLDAENALKALDEYLRKTPSLYLHRELLPPKDEDL
ncbi:hypothetical protein JR316_0006717 [Psilocybe cubensis]|uniref:Protein kinase domain-containing protein n=2 Tax=Psilocybe cubensis TaxID=181762 RepID=A0A8H7XNA7_PSICU|nr:hypothetical protein JR316_0006717 [Psilocybe cubensis]KAH9480120.1 hypothetical protein JR316_0006717 [Psilocybe cubensis]